MKFIIGLVVGVAIGGWLGINYGKDNSLFSNPFAEKSVAEKVMDKGEAMLEAGEDVLKKGAELLPEK